MQTAVQLYTFDASPLSLSAQLEAVAEAGFDGVEFAGLGTDPGPVRSTLARFDLAAPSAHIPLSTLESGVESAVEPYRELGVETVVIPSLDPKRLQEGTIRGAAAAIDSVAGALDRQGFGLAYHNHDAEFERIGELFALDVLLAETGVGLELDVGWAAAADADPVALIDRYADRLTAIHLKDVRLDLTAPRGGVAVDLGEGDVDLDGCLAVAADADVEWIVFEYDAPPEPLVSLQAAGDWIAGKTHH
ncbi:sugar phosphate isomerase/epimerase family protein [Halohasta litorea]|uniref:Sugar phosphate isomerase/epimerase family protein n=1 Tax=Halohasta litorea TaxID=869891 RepID=A0ABD6DDE0_9EURY|nr:sugar phosphate isomerase/epimerase [Halohasta litorea]